MKAIIKAQGDVSKTHARDLMEKYCPDVPYQRGPFGGDNWGETFWSSYLFEGVKDLLILRMEDRIRELESK